MKPIRLASIPRTLALAACCASAFSAPLSIAAQSADQSAAATRAALTTHAERSGFLQTGRYQEVIGLCADFQRAYPKQVRCIQFGSTPEGRPMMALVVSNSGALTPAEAQKRGLPVVLIQGGIHAGEIEGKDAGFLALRDLLAVPKSGKGGKDGRDTTAASDGDPLARQVLVFVPVFNVDGHERFGPWNRPNQRGPEQMGRRSTAQNHNLNRDYLKADSPEMQAMLALHNTWDPLVMVDLHTTNGAKFEHDVAAIVSGVHAGDVALRGAARAFRDGVIAELAARGSLPLPFYPSFDVDDDPTSGISDSVYRPRYSAGYSILRNRIGMLVETHSWKDYPTRVRVTRNTVDAALRLVAAHGAGWRDTAREADVRAASLGGTEVALHYAPGARRRTIDFRGYEYTRTLSEVSGALMTRYDESRPQIWKMPLRDEMEVSISARAPQGGYLVQAAHAAMVGAKLRQHGVQFRTLAKDVAAAPVEACRAAKAEFGPRSYESHQTLSAPCEWKTETRELLAGSLLVPVAQAKARLVIALLEPRAPDSLLSWGFFNNHYEQKEYMEFYVAEDVARQQLAADPSLAKAFRARLEADPAFAKDPAARLDFFYRRHSSWDESTNLYPVLRYGKEFAPAVR